MYHVNYNSEFAKGKIPPFKGYYAVTTRFLCQKYQQTEQLPLPQPSQATYWSNVKQKTKKNKKTRKKKERKRSLSHPVFSVDVRTVF